MQQNKLIEIISDDNLNVSNEETVFNSCIRWRNHLIETRSADFYKVLEHVRLPLLDAYFLNDQVQNDKYFKQCDKSRELIQEAQSYNLLVNRQNQIQNERTCSRCAFHYIDALIIIGKLNLVIS